jgi:hypothetical protein
LRSPRLILILSILLAAAGGAYAWYPPFRLFTWVAAGRSPDCPLSQALQSERNAQLEKESNERFIKESKLISLDRQGLELWQTPKGRFWIPGGRRGLLPFHLAAQECRIYGTGDAGPHADDTALDWGAAIGVTVNAELLAGAARVVAIEPSSENLECLRRNFSNEIATGRVLLYASEPLTTIDKVVAELKPARVDYIKFDLDSGGTLPLAGARDTISRFKPRISVATYGMAGYSKPVERIIRSFRSDYEVRCGPCAPVKEAHSIRPDVLYFK